MSGQKKIDVFDTPYQPIRCTRCSELLTYLYRLADGLICGCDGCKLIYERAVRE